MKVGVYNSQFSIDFSGTEKFYRDLAEIAKKHKMSAEEFTKIANSIKEEEPARRSYGQDKRRTFLFAGDRERKKPGRDLPISLDFHSVSKT